MNNNGSFNPYTFKIPGGTLTKVQLVSPTNVAIQWPNPTGGNLPSKPPASRSFLKSIFG